MKAQEHTWRTGRLRGITPAACRLPVLVLAVTAAAILTSAFGAKASEMSAEDRAAQADNAAVADSAVPGD